jgi:hypothetical protein
MKEVTDFKGGPQSEGGRVFYFYFFIFLFFHFFQIFQRVDQPCKRTTNFFLTVKADADKG